MKQGRRPSADPGPVEGLAGEMQSECAPFFYHLAFVGYAGLLNTPPFEHGNCSPLPLPGHG